MVVTRWQIGNGGFCNMAFESTVVPIDWRSAVIVSLFKGKGVRNECKNYRGIGLLSVVGKIDTRS